MLRLGFSATMGRGTRFAFTSVLGGDPAFFAGRTGLSDFSRTNAGPEKMILLLSRRPGRRKAVFWCAAFEIADFSLTAAGAVRISACARRHASGGVSRAAKGADCKSAG